MLHLQFACESGGIIPAVDQLQQWFLATNSPPPGHAIGSASRTLIEIDCWLSSRAWQGPWIKPDNAQVEDLVAISKSCPPGAITYERHDGGDDECAPDVIVIRVLENGPLAVTANIHIARQGPRKRATLCRCGGSKTNPFCDGSHRKFGFTTE